jgi:hypothetical protein
VDVLILYVSQVKAEMGCDPVSSGLLGRQSCGNEIRLCVRRFRHLAVAGLTQCRDVIDIDSEFDHIGLIKS